MNTIKDPHYQELVFKQEVKFSKENKANNISKVAHRYSKRTG